MSMLGRAGGPAFDGRRPPGVTGLEELPPHAGCVLAE
jgi:hypothetical protein